DPMRSESGIQELNNAVERRVAERTAQLEKANKELESFCYSVSHDLRAPLCSIDGFSQALLEDCAGNLDPKRIDYLHRVRASAQRMGELIDALLQLSRLGRTDLHRQQVDLSEMARTVVLELLERLPGRRVEVDIEEALVVDADRRLMRVVLDNLLGNAWKFTANVVQPRVQVSRDRGGDEPVYFVRDKARKFRSPNVVAGSRAGNRGDGVPARNSPPEAATGIDQM